MNVEKTRAELNSLVKKALKKHSKAEVKRALRQKSATLQARMLFATKGGILGTDDYDTLQKCVKILNEAINKL